ncbi:MAG: hypothetical protein ACREMD_01815 [Gemmatimonadota bacterium]
MAAVGSLDLALMAALLLGLRHATDPDHLTAVSTLVLSDERTARQAGVLGLFWGLGHATTLFLFGVPIVLLGARLPEIVQRGAEFAVGVLIVILAARLLLRWRRGVFHAHPHAHGEVWHAHPHAHGEAHADAIHPGGEHVPVHDHPHAEGIGRSPLASFGIGLVHGLGGTAGTGLLLAAAIPGRADAVLTLTVFALGTAISMVALSVVFGYGLARRAVADRLPLLVPSAGVLGLLFGIWYALGALGVDRGVS